MTRDKRVSDEVADRVRQVRKAKGLTGLSVADRAEGITWQAISNIETGRRDAEGSRRRAVTVDELVILAQALNVNVTWLLEGSDGCTTCHGKPPPGFQCRACGA